MADLDFWNVDNEMIGSAYGRDNYKIIDLKKSNKCYIFFSSHGLYYPNKKEIFEKVIIQKDRYEWKNSALSKPIADTAGRIIFVRDICKQFYVRGINKELDSVDKVIEKLRVLTKGYEVVTIGSSGGGIWQH